MQLETMTASPYPHCSHHWICSVKYRKEAADFDLAGGRWLSRVLGGGAVQTKIPWELGKGNGVAIAVHICMPSYTFDPGCASTDR
jgi:hypothetical protein